jgi:Protein of unknown function (DUF4232)
MKATRIASYKRLWETALATAAVGVVAGLAGVSTATATSGGARAPERAAACLGSEIDVWLNTQGDGAAGSTFYALEFTNLSSHSCTLSGFPHVSAIDLLGHQIGLAASHDNASSSRTITLAGSSGHSFGDTGTVALRIVRAEDFPSTSCHIVTAAGLRVYAPGAVSADVIPFPFEACSQDDATLMIEAIQK